MKTKLKYLLIVIAATLILYGIVELVNYPFAKDKWASGFTDLCFFTEVLFKSPPVYSQVPYEVLMSYTDNANIQLLSLTSKPLKMVWFYAPSYIKSIG